MTNHPHNDNTAISQGFDLIILAGGAATRLGDLAANTPKTLLPIHGRPCLLHQTESLLAACAHIRRISIIVRASDAQHYPPVLAQIPCPTRLIHEHTPLGTGGALLGAAAMPDISPLFLAMNGDVLLTPTPYELLETASMRGAAMQYVDVPDTHGLGHLTITANRITAMSRGTGGQGYINAGLYAFDKRVLHRDDVSPAVSSFEDDIVPALINAGQLGAVKTDGHFIDIGTPSAYVAAQSVSHKKLASQAV